MPRDELPRDLDAYPLVELEPVFSLRGLIAWLETQPPEREYCFKDTGGCLLFKYLDACGKRPLSVGGFTWRDESGSNHELSEEFREVARTEPRTFGDALNRAIHIEYGPWYARLLTRARVALSGLE